LLSISVCALDEESRQAGKGTLAPAQALGRLMARQPEFSDLIAGLLVARPPKHRAIVSAVTRRCRPMLLRLTSIKSGPLQ
jgi:hypothetical protein